MSSGINKEWMKEKNFDSDAYRNGVLEFLTFVHQNVPGEKHSCPCKRCRNGNGQIDVGDIFIHLMKHGMDEEYTLWHFHGETSVVSLVPQSQQIGTTFDTPHHAEQSDFPRLNDLVNDVCEIFTGDSRVNDVGILPYADGPLHKVTSYSKFQCNGYTFSTLAHEENLRTQSSGVSTKAYNKKGVLTTFYGVIREILDLDYIGFRHTVFYCDWVDVDEKNACKVDPTSKLVMVNLNKLMSRNSVQDEPFILASQASQVFYCKDAKLEGWSVVLHTPKRLTKAIDALEIDRTMY